MTTLAMAEAAIQCGVSESTIRKWVMRGYLKPVRRGAKPLRFDETALMKCASERISAVEHARLDALWADMLASD